MNKKLTMHQVNEANRLLDIAVVGYGKDGSGRHYHITSPNGFSTDINFQTGSVSVGGITGLTVESLLAILIDRMEGHCVGPNSVHENDLSLLKLREAMLWMNRRTLDRMCRGVEGTESV